MKITIESLGKGDAKVNLNFNGKDYYETWSDTGSVYTSDCSILTKMELDGIPLRNTDIEDLLNAVGCEIIDFISLADREKEWVDA